MKDETWITKDGRRLLVSEMSEGHAKAALCMMIHRHDRLIGFVDLVEGELKRRKTAREESEEFRRCQIDEEFWSEEGRYGSGW